jgi:hypothetical protein
METPARRFVLPTFVSPSDEGFVLKGLEDSARGFNPGNMSKKTARPEEAVGQV